MVILWQLLAQFIFRVTFGMALAMAVAPSRLVTSGYFRVQLWVLMGLNTVAALAIYSSPAAFERAAFNSGWLLTLGIALTVLCYVGSVIWLYEQRAAGVVALLVVAGLGLLAAAQAPPWLSSDVTGAAAWRLLDRVTSGGLLGVTLAAMLLGHWYLNTPTMQLAPLRHLVVWMMVAVVLRSLLCGAALLGQMFLDMPTETTVWLFIAFRWLSGLLGAGLMAVMSWYTLKVPNTQSATGILYAGVILTFIGELVSLLLSGSMQYPV